MEEKWIVELTAKTIAEISNIINYSSSNYAKDFEVETDRVDKAKLEKIGNMIEPLKFFIEKSGFTAEASEGPKIGGG